MNTKQYGKAHWFVMAILAVLMALILIHTSDKGEEKETPKPEMVEVKKPVSLNPPRNKPTKVESPVKEETPVDSKPPTLDLVKGENPKPEKKLPVVIAKPPLNTTTKEDILNIIASRSNTGISVIPDNAPVNYSRYTDQYDGLFRSWTKKYWGVQYDWRMFKAQAIQESALKVNAKSWVGAQGLMQIMPATYGDIVRREPNIKNDPYTPKWNIAAGVWYMKDMWRIFKRAKTPNDRLKMAQGAYNGGAGNILWGIRRCKAYAPKLVECTTWHNMSVAVIAHPPKRWIYHETLGYVSRISWLMGQEKTPVPPKPGKKASTYQMNED